MRSKILWLSILLIIMALPFAAWLPAHLISAANSGSNQANVTVYATPTFGNGSSPPDGGGGGGGGAAGVTPVLNVVTEKGRFTEDVIAKSNDRKVELYIPENTIGLNRVGQLISSILIKEMEEPPATPIDSEVIGLVYRLGPDGATFDPPVDLSIKYDESKIPDGFTEQNLIVATFDITTGQWEKLESTVDIENDSVTAKVSHFSPFTILAYTRPASFTVTDLSLTPGEVNLGESISISILITNDGDLTGSYEINLQIDELLVQTKEVTLAGGDSETVSFIITLDTIGEHVINVGGLFGTCEVRAPKAPAKFVTSALTVSPDEVGVGESVSIKINVTNTGELPGTYELILKVDGQVTDTKEINLAGQESRQVMFTLSRDIAGSYVISIDDLSGMLRVYSQLAPPENGSALPPAPPIIPPAEPVEPAEQPATPISINLWVITAIIAAGLIGGIGLMFVIRLRRH